MLFGGNPRYENTPLIGRGSPPPTVTGLPQRVGMGGWGGAEGSGPGVCLVRAAPAPSRELGRDHPGSKLGALRPGCSRGPSPVLRTCVPCRGHGDAAAVSALDAHGPAGRNCPRLCGPEEVLWGWMAGAIPQSLGSARGDTWPHLLAFLVVTSGGSCRWHLAGRGQGCCSAPSTAPTSKNDRPVSLVL